LNGKDNVAILSFRKHFLAHWLLTKCTMKPDRVKLLAALAGMRRTLKNGRKIVSGWQFAIARLALAERTRALHADPEFAARRDARLRAMHADPEFAAKLVERMRASAHARNADPKFAARSAEKLRAMHADPEYSARHSANMRARMRKMNMARTPEQRSKASHKGQAARTLEQSVEWAHKVQMALTHDQRSEIAYKNNAARTPEQRSEAIRKGHATRAARRAAALQSEASLFCERIAPKEKAIR
jgi:hypothetical protein